MEKWVEEEFSELNFGDKRVNTTGKIIIDTLAKRPGSTIPTAFNTASEAKCCYEFFANGKVTWDKILKPHIKATLERIRLESIVLMPTDTTDLNYTSKPSIRDLGYLTNKNKGFYLHPLIAITPERVPLGIVNAKFLKRDVKDIELTDHQLYDSPIEEKENYRWIESYNEACKVAKECPDTHIITITDREGDFAELFETVWKFQQNNEDYADIIVRSYHDRAIDSEEKLTPEDSEQRKLEKKLRSKLKSAPALGEINFKISKTPTRTGRTVTQKLKTAQVTFKKRATSKNSKNQKVTMNAVMAIEENPPEGIEPLIWIFLTTLPIDTFEQAAKVVQFYLGRWEIEVFFKVLKSGCIVEERRLSEGENMLSLIALLMMIAWRIMYVMKLGRSCPEMSCEVLFSASEWKSVYKVANQGGKLPEKAPLLGEFIVLIAKLGGYLNRKNDPPPGPKMMWIGLSRMYDFSLAWDSFENNRV